MAHNELVYSTNGEDFDCSFDYLLRSMKIKNNLKIGAEYFSGTKVEINLSDNLTLQNVKIFFDSLLKDSDNPLRDLEKDLIHEYEIHRKLHIEDRWLESFIKEWRKASAKSTTTWFIVTDVEKAYLTAEDIEKYKCLTDSIKN